jgi:hypothetical protein
LAKGPTLLRGIIKYDMALDIYVSKPTYGAVSKASSDKIAPTKILHFQPQTENKKNASLSY